MLPFIKLAPMDGEKNGAVGTQEIPVGPTYGSIRFKVLNGSNLATVAQIKDLIDEIRFLVNGDVQRRYSADDLGMLVGVRGVTVRDGFINIYFAEQWRRTYDGELQTVLGTGDLRTISFEFEFAAAVGATITDFRVETYAEIIPGPARPMGDIVHIRKFTFPDLIVGENQLTRLPRGIDYRAIHIKAANLSKVEVITDTTRVHLKSDTQSYNEYLQDRGWKLQPGWQHLIFDVDAGKNQFLSTKNPAHVLAGIENPDPVDNFMLVLTATATGPVSIVAETVGPRMAG